jgi:predicted transcriptional regulator YdeE
MNITIMHSNFKTDIYGFSGTAVNKDYAGTAFKLMDRMWQAVKTKELKNKGNNIWVYDSNDNVFAGVELYKTPDPDTGLEQKSIDLPKYAYFKHIGPYHLIKQAVQHMQDEIKIRGLEPGLPYIEIYGHWTKDESKQETELLMALK